MKIDKKISKAFLLSLVLASSGNSQKAEAGIVTITNYSQSELNINVIAPPNGAPYCKKCLGSSLEMCGNETAKIVVPLDALCGGEYFSVLDITNGFMGGSKCRNLSVYKNYDVSFYETTLGTRCHCAEISS